MAAHEGGIRPDRTHEEARPTPRGGEAASFGNLFRKLADDSADLIRHEVSLARLEMQETARAFARDGMKVAVALGIAGVGALALTTCLILVLGILLGGAYWASSLIVGALFLLIGGILAYSGINDMKKQSIKPEETIETLREDRRFARREAEDFKRDIAA